ncbi:MAG: HD domain-containing phosphohydrolase [Bacillota bacterium]
MRLVPVDKLKTNAEIAIDVVNSQGILLVAEGQELTPRIIQILNKVDLEYIYINDDLTTPAEKRNLVTSDSTSLMNIINQLKNITRRMSMGMANAGDILKLNNISFDIVETYYQLGDDFRIVYEPVKMVLNSALEQSLYVAIMGVGLGMKMGLTRPQLSELCMTGLLKDFALISPKATVSAKAAISQEELDETHMVIAYRLLRQYSQVTPRILDGIVHHHEQYDGSGYPNGQQGEEISVYSRVLAVVNYFYELKSDSAIMVTEQSLLEIVFADALKQFDPKIVDVFIKNVELFTIDTLVRLTNGDAAIVVRNNANAPFLPTVRILRSEIFEVGKEIDLQDSPILNLKISSVIYYVD